MGIDSKPAGNRPVQPVSDRFFYWLRATMLETRRLGYWWANRMLQTTHPRRAEDGAAVARPLRDPREQGPRLPQDDAADRPVRAGRHRQPARPDHPGRAEPGDAVLPRRAVQRQGRAERELRPRGDGALHHGRRQLHREGRARMRARVHRVVLRQPHVQGRPGQARRRREDVPGPDRELRRRRRAEDHLRAAGDGGVPGRRRSIASWCATSCRRSCGRSSARCCASTTTRSSRC